MLDPRLGSKAKDLINPASGADDLAFHADGKVLSPCRQQIWRTRRVISLGGDPLDSQKDS